VISRCGTLQCYRGNSQRRNKARTSNCRGCGPILDQNTYLFAVIWEARARVSHRSYRVHFKPIWPWRRVIYPDLGKRSSSTRTYTIDIPASLQWPGLCTMATTNASWGTVNTLCFSVLSMHWETCKLWFNQEIPLTVLGSCIWPFKPRLFVFVQNAFGLPGV
jgi:hypothetical protein